ncbi:class II fructose-1,6-bisphosphate aldolase [Alicyclobacillus mali]|uniref:Class II fructose-1,6-bisphosphate aldolase n=1 Tax=Alicyclobacillus mali (ex Roth et al. 2021) TaxID=1123961 RepID=A0ABS0F1I4_9BACL|nr:class II fructose-1,6-bisphosphate aldolase [Alicyclobacillus mali (ex Roth et al. 2021)]MBF8377138.1 class II fructose-1,6-bisphosphate aldolase [Alicyclobacillus mali (ex Roth et al. 2021)]
MGLVSMDVLLRNARADHYAVGQFNVNGLEWFEAVLRAAQEEESPVIIGVSDRLVDYLGGFRAIFQIVTSYIKRMEIVVPCVLHLDHAHTFERCAEAVDAGFTSVMIDGSHLSLEENVELTTRVVHYAHAHQVSVEAEVGRVGGIENGEVSDMKNADPDECVEFVKRTGVDALAAALGSVHGFYENPQIDIKALKYISEKISTPLVLHGGSGISGSYLAEVIHAGYSKVNVNTDCAIAWRDTIKHYLEEHPNIYEPHTILHKGAEAIYQVVRMKIREFGSKGKARVLL